VEGRCPWLPSTSRRSRGFSRLQSLYRPNRLGSSWLASTPYVLGIPRTLGSSALSRPEFTVKFTQASPLVPFHATSAHCPLARRPPTGVPCRHDPPSVNTSLELCCPSASTDPGALFFTLPFGKACRKCCPISNKSHPQGLATLSVVCSFRDP
jgi:hypothetical protein